MAFVDYKKAFDSIEISDVLETLQEQGIEPVYINIFKHIYKQAKSFIRLYKDSKPFHLGRRVRQGETSSPKLFRPVSRNFSKKLRWENRGIRIDGEFINHLRFADDIIIFASSSEELQRMLRELNQASLLVGFSMNLIKTKIMTNNHTEVDNSMITIDNNKIELDHCGKEISNRNWSRHLKNIRGHQGVKEFNFDRDLFRKDNASVVGNFILQKVNSRHVRTFTSVNAFPWTQLQKNKK